MKPDYKIIDVTKDQMSTDIEGQLLRVKPMPGDVLALKCSGPEEYCYLPFLVLFDPTAEVSGYFKMVKDIVKWLELDEKFQQRGEEPVKISDEDLCLNMDIEAGYLTASEAYHAFLTKELPEDYTGYLADPEDCLGEEWKESLKNIPSYTEWCSKITDSPCIKPINGKCDHVNELDMDVHVYDVEKRMGINSKGNLVLL